MKDTNYHTDVALLSVTNLEFAAVTYFHNWKAKTLSGDDQIYDVATFEREGKTRTLVHAKLDEMGMTAAAATAMKVIYEFRPRYLIMVGIAAGIALDNVVAEQMYGDVVVPNIVNECHVHIGPMACGSTVVANRKVLEKQIHSQLSSTVGLDMESYAVVYAAYHAPKPRPVPIIVKSVCDFANSEKSDEYQKFAAYTSCEFAKFLYEKFLPMD